MTPSDLAYDYADPTHHELPPSTDASVDVSTLLGPPNVTAPLPDPMPDDEAYGASWAQLAAVIVAVDNLLKAGMVGHARSVLGDARRIIEAARGSSADPADASLAQPAESSTIRRVMRS